MSGVKTGIFGDDGGNTYRVGVSKKTGLPPSLHVLTENARNLNPTFAGFVNDTYGLAMNQNAVFSGTALNVYDGSVTTYWTPNSITGGKWTDGSTAESHSGGASLRLNNGNVGHIYEFANNDASTVTAAGGRTLTFAASGLTITASTGSFLTDGYQRGQTVVIAGTSSNDGSKLIDTVTALVITLDSGESLTNEGPLSGGETLDATATIQGSSYVALSAFIFVDQNWNEGDSISVYGYDSNTASVIGTPVFIEDVVDVFQFDVWHSAIFTIAALGLEAQGFDSIRIQIVTEVGTGPRVYFDDFSLQQAGGAITYTSRPVAGTLYHADKLALILVDALDTTLADNSVFNITYNKILGLAKLANGIVFRRYSDNRLSFSTSATQMTDFLLGGFRIVEKFADATNVCIILEVTFASTIILDSRTLDRFEIEIDDDLSGLVEFRGSLRGSSETL